ncbi:MAG: hypothetical protein AAFO81_10225 [Pseudomonadota bacterium]
MFVSEKLVFLELHKTGGSHIGHWLRQTLGGEQVGKHNRLAPELRDRFIVGSIRNPWDWYVSLWAYGCSSRGSVWRQTIDGVNLRYYREQLAAEMGRANVGVQTLLRQAWSDLRKDQNAWIDCYRDSNDAARFRRWLNRVLNGGHALDLREGFGFSAVSQHSGLMTYRYLKLFTDLGDALYSDPRLGTTQGMRSTLEERFLLNHCIRSESLEPDLVEAITNAGYELSDTQRSAILESGKQKVNASKRNTTGFYYDAQTRDLVAEREQLIIEQHRYAAPELDGH